MRSVFYLYEVVWAQIKGHTWWPAQVIIKI